MDSMSRKEKEKLSREEDIVTAAEEVFTLLGYNKASMEDIAKEAQFTRKTVYQYFADKEDLFFAVIIRGFKRLLFYCKEDIDTGVTGFENLRKIAAAYNRFYRDYPGTLQLMNYVGYVKSCTNSPRLEEFNNVSELLIQEISKVINLGKADGSIRTDLDTSKLTLSAEFIISGFFHMLSISGKTFTKNYSLEEESFIDFSINLLCEAFTKR